MDERSVLLVEDGWASYLRSRAEFDFFDLGGTGCECESASYCFVAVIIHGTWFPLESSVLSPRCDTLVSCLFLGGTFPDTRQDLRIFISTSS